MYQFWGSGNVRENSAEYKIWLKNRNAKNLIHRTLKKEHKRLKISKQQAYNRKLKHNSNYSSKNRNISFFAPNCFSFINNTNETICFFKDIISFITNKRNYRKRIFIDICHVESLSIDALMYLLAIVTNLKKSFKNNFEFSGSVPENTDVKRLLNESGFFNYVRYQGTDNIIKNNNNVQIISGNHSEPIVAKRIIDFVTKKALISKRKCSFLYDTIIELMANSQKHAYNENELLVHCWYCFVKYDQVDTISFIFMDTGAGIPATIRKDFIERIKLLNLNKDASFVESVLNGDFRTATKQTYRGKGLPQIRKYCKQNKIQNLRIITNYADVQVTNNDYISTNLSQPIIGTVYCWDISIANLKGV